MEDAGPNVLLYGEKDSEAAAHRAAPCEQLGELYQPAAEDEKPQRDTNDKHD